MDGIKKDFTAADSNVGQEKFGFGFFQTRSREELEDNEKIKSHEQQIFWRANKRENVTVFKSFPWLQHAVGHRNNIYISTY